MFIPAEFLSSFLEKFFQVENERLRKVIHIVLFFLIAYIIGIIFKFTLIKLDAFPLTKILANIF
ncbi:hypothetical protein A6A10_07435 [Otariodibacter oris]|uniref:Uncharacterized protein n=1 Tax=Otariodibacter oris TaxID=1032623 RepID=A0A420XGY4_9PAST|nr:hypothetical protein A6A10_07435 [Otariodibacter oris]RKR72813.1 hypothetical protein DES31_0980 [Otariodibacter oris]